MKKLGKLSINPEKVLKNEELVNLRGGYGGYGTGACAVNCEMPDGGVIRNLSKEHALDLYNSCAGYPRNWCCDSCGSASWY